MVRGDVMDETPETSRTVSRDGVNLADHGTEFFERLDRVKVIAKRNIESDVAGRGELTPRAGAQCAKFHLAATEAERHRHVRRIFCLTSKMSRSE